MYLRPRFLEELHAIREEMSRESHYDMDLFAQKLRQEQRDGKIVVADIEDYPSAKSIKPKNLKRKKPRK